MSHFPLPLPLQSIHPLVLGKWDRGGQSVASPLGGSKEIQRLFPGAWNPCEESITTTTSPVHPPVALPPSTSSRASDTQWNRKNSSPSLQGEKLNWRRSSTRRLHCGGESKNLLLFPLLHGHRQRPKETVACVSVWIRPATGAYAFCRLSCWSPPWTHSYEEGLCVLLVSSATRVVGHQKLLGATRC